MVKGVFEFCLLRIFAALLQKVITILGKKFRRFAACVRPSRHRVVVDEFAASFVEGGDEAVVVGEGRQHESVVLLVNLQNCAHVQFGILRKVKK